ncbi:DUF4142 domain-containing protein [Microvirga roseola]|uniref:DUF4142 domain-containing protein n=1 Tax=Microvirga roseola TaxID=2883126 RepID=UPI001E41246D|nr:DUF4142 domain-containing protein [Microvirga roseola]
MSRRHLVIAGFAAALVLPAAAQQVQENRAIPYPVDPAPAARQLNPGLDQGIQQRQQRLQQGGAPQDTRSAAPPSAGRMPAQGNQMGQTGQTGVVNTQLDETQSAAQYIRQSLAVGTVSLQNSYFARSKAQHPRVRQFAEFEIAEQTALETVLQSFNEPAATASTRAAQAASTAPVIPPQKDAPMVQLSHAQPGPAFDRAYVEAEIRNHRDLLAVQERYLQSNPANHTARSVAMLVIPHVREHLVLLQDIQGELGR